MPALVANNPNRRKSEETDLSAVKTLRKALAILDAFAAAERPLTVAEVAVRAGVTRPTAHRLIQTLIGEGYLAQDPGRQPHHARLFGADARRKPARHQPDPAGIDAASRDAGAHDRRAGEPRHPASPPDALPRRRGEAVAAYDLQPLRENDAGLFLRDLARRSSRILSEAELSRYFRAVPLVRQTESTIIDEAALRAELAEIRRQGVASTAAREHRATYCLAAPIIVHDAPVAAIAVTGRALEPLMPYKDDVQHTAEVIGHVLGRGE